MAPTSSSSSSSSSSYKLQTLTNFIFRYRAISGCSWRRGGGTLDQGLRCLSVSSKLGMETKNQSDREQPQLPAPPKFGFSNWMKWLMGSVVTFLLPFWKSKWVNFLILEGEVAKVVGEVEVVAEVVEKVATTADKALEEVVNQLPDNSKLKEAAQALEHVSNVAAHDAQIIENIINKVSDVKQDLEDLESFVEPIVEKIIQVNKNTKK